MPYQRYGTMFFNREKLKEKCFKNCKVLRELVDIKQMLSQIEPEEKTVMTLEIVKEEKKTSQVVDPPEDVSYGQFKKSLIAIKEWKLKHVDAN